MAIVISIPRILQAKLGHDGADALAETLNKMQESHQNNILEIAGNKFEKRLTEEASRLDNKITVEVSRLENKITEEGSRLDNKITSEVSRLDNKISQVQSNLIKWMFLFWLGQVSLFLAFLK